MELTSKTHAAYMLSYQYDEKKVDAVLAQIGTDFLTDSQIRDACEILDEDSDWERGPAPMPASVNEHGWDLTPGLYPTFVGI